MNTVAFDLRDAVRGLLRDRGYSATVFLTLALTIGGTTAIFTLIHAVMVQ